jgi:acyl carrier protein
MGEGGGAMTTDSNQLLDLMALVLRLDRSTVSMETSMDNTGEWDSLRHLSVILALEDEFKVRIPDDEVQHLISISLIHEWLNADP